MYNMPFIEGFIFNKLNAFVDKQKDKIFNDYSTNFCYPEYKWWMVQGCWVNNLSFEFLAFKYNFLDTGTKLGKELARRIVWINPSVKTGKEQVIWYPQHKVRR